VEWRNGAPNLLHQIFSLKLTFHLCQPSVDRLARPSSRTRSPRIATMKWTAAAAGVLALAGSAFGLVPVDDLVREAVAQGRSADIFVQVRGQRDPHPPPRD